MQCIAGCIAVWLEIAVTETLGPCSAPVTEKGITFAVLCPKADEGKTFLVSFRLVLKYCVSKSRLYSM